VPSENRLPIADFSASGKEVAAFDAGEEFVGQVRYYLFHPEEHADSSERPCARAQREHTYELRLKRMFEILGFTTGACEPWEGPSASRREQ
jgi:spore maturation protein CgeB